jgi:hypothetical protein
VESNHQGRLTAIGALVLPLLYACAGNGTRVPQTVASVGLPHSQEREAEGGGFVTVDISVFSGVTQPDTAMPAGSDSLNIARFSNRGEGGKREKRYDWKPRDSASYLLVLSPGASGRTKWTMIEVDSVGGGRRVHRTGYLRTCEGKRHIWPTRSAGFKDCDLTVPYDPLEIAAVNSTELVQFASYIGDREFPPQDAPAWISCNSGCCSLGQADAGVTSIALHSLRWPRRY